MPELDTEEVKEELIGHAVRQKDGEVPCNTNPELVDDEYIGDSCKGTMKEGDSMVVWFVNEDSLYADDRGWHVKYEFCPGCCEYESFPGGARKEDVDQVLARAELQRTGAYLEGEFSEDALTLVDVEILDRSPENEGV
ncbi:MAG: hypothetical protein ABEK59_12180 [Halobacteria archaeon]